MDGNDRALKGTQAEMDLRPRRRDPKWGFPYDRRREARRHGGKLRRKGNDDETLPETALIELAKAGLPFNLATHQAAMRTGGLSGTREFDMTRTLRKSPDRETAPLHARPATRELGWTRGTRSF